MKIEASGEDGGTIILKEVFCSAVLETAEGNKLAVCMRDDTVEMSVVGSEIWHRANMQTGSVDQMTGPIAACIEPTLSDQGLIAVPVDTLQCIAAGPDCSEADSKAALADIIGRLHQHHINGG
jgi:hypothetical protein